MVVFFLEVVVFLLASCRGFCCGLLVLLSLWCFCTSVAVCRGVCCGVCMLCCSVCCVSIGVCLPGGFLLCCTMYSCVSMCVVGCGMCVVVCCLLMGRCVRMCCIGCCSCFCIVCAGVVVFVFAVVCFFFFGVLLCRGVLDYVQGVCK
ncbi:hypothetical protein GDO81_026242 [Engystomops pustulosus]|uniref:NADH dehydrogenase subunit 6 n=1 Tax=Engystomops pustulosus TaxID=76066 RepID=A0AAV6ZPN7_ENGPU|nr:hypothetical protein GDO81_026242 [Engystomops pustulosus]